MRLKDTLFLLANGYSKKEIDALDAQEAEALKAEAEAKAEAEKKEAEAEAKKKEAESEKLTGVTKELEEAKKALEAQQKKNTQEIDMGSPSVDDKSTIDEFLKTIASYM